MANKWQKRYLDIYYGGKLPRSKAGKEEFAFLGKCTGDSVTVHFPDFNGINGFVPAHIETYRIDPDKCDVPHGIISVEALAANLPFWTARGYLIEY